MRPESLIYTGPKGDFEHPGPFHVGEPPGVAGNAKVLCAVAGQTQFMWTSTVITCQSGQFFEIARTSHLLRNCRTRKENHSHTQC